MSRNSKTVNREDNFSTAISSSGNRSVSNGSDYARSDGHHNSRERSAGRSKASFAHDKHVRRQDSLGHRRGQAARRGHERSAVTEDSGRGGLSQALRENENRRIADLSTKSSPASKSYVTANHLLNFQYDGRTQRGGQSTGGRSGNNGRRYPAPRFHKYDKNKFLQANFRFVVSDAIDVRQFLAEADRMLDWEDVVQVEMLSSTPVQCPISLDSPPMCPQITPCGHVFSFCSIMQHFMHAGGEDLRRSARCPLCYTQIVARELRLLKIRHVEAPKVGDSVRFQLLRRPKNTIIPACVGQQPADLPASAVSLSAAETKGQGEAFWAKFNASNELSGSPLDGNVFAKFVVVSGAEPLWRSAASELADYACKVEAGGGLEAEAELPLVHAAVLSLAKRARRWAEHRALELAGGGIPGAQPAEEVPAELEGSRAEALVKQYFKEAKVLAAERYDTAALRAAREVQYPSLTWDQTTRDHRPPMPAVQAPQVPTPVWLAAVSSAAKPSGEDALPAGCATDAAGQGASSSAGPSAPGQEEASPGAGTGAKAKTREYEDWGEQEAVPAPSPAAGPQERGGVARESQDPGAVCGESGEEVDAGEGPEYPFEPAFSDDELQEQGEQQPLQCDGDSDGGEDSPPYRFEVSNASGAQRSASARQMPNPRELSTSLVSEWSLEGVLGTSPNTAKLNTATPAGDFFMYQAADGQWLFLHPLDARCLLQHYGSYACCPPTVTAPVLEVEDVVQEAATRRRWKFLSHLPLTGQFRLCEVALDAVLPPEALAPFADELAQRDRRRQRRAEYERLAAERETAAAQAAQAARRGPSAAELRAMPLPSATLVLGEAAAEVAPALAGVVHDEELEAALALQVAYDSSPAGTSPPQSGVSFAHITRMGYAATGPALGTSPVFGGTGALMAVPLLQSPAPSSAPSNPSPTGVWANKSGKTAVGTGAAGLVGRGDISQDVRAESSGAAAPESWAALRSCSQSAKAAHTSPESVQTGGQGKGKGKKGMLVFSTTQRRY